MNKIITNPVTGRMETVADPKSEATPETVREARRQLREKLNPSGEGWHKDELGSNPEQPSNPFPHIILEDES